MERDIRGEGNLAVGLAADEVEEVEEDDEGEGDKYLEETCRPLDFLVTVEPLSLRGGF